MATPTLYHVDARDPDSCLDVCVASAVLSEPPPAPFLVVVFLKHKNGKYQQIKGDSES